MKKIYVGALLALVLAQPVFGMEEGCSNTVVRSFQEQATLNTKLFDAINENDLSQVEQLLKEGADVNARSMNNNNTPLLVACRKGNAALVNALLAQCTITVNHKDYTSSTPLHKACKLGAPEIAKLLLKRLTKSEIHWQQVRLMFIGRLKKNDQGPDSPFSRMPIEMIRHILSFCRAKNIEALRSFICQSDFMGSTAFTGATPLVKKELGHILDPQAWQDDETAENTYDALVKLLQEDEKKQSNQNGLQQE